MPILTTSAVVACAAASARLRFLNACAGLHLEIACTNEIFLFIHRYLTSDIDRPSGTVIDNDNLRESLLPVWQITRIDKLFLHTIDYASL